MRIERLNIAYGDRAVYRDWQAEFPDNGVTCLMGASGVGKTTLLHALAGQLPYCGQIEMPSDGAAYVYQQPRLIGGICVRENLRFVLSGLPREQADKRIERYCACLHISHLLDRMPLTLSGGEQGRVALARAFCHGGNPLLMDEPFRGLDIGLKSEILASLIELLQDSPRTVVWATHDPEEALMLSDRIFVLAGSPVRAAYRCDIVTPRSERSLADVSLAQLRRKLYAALSAPRQREISDTV